MKLCMVVGLPCVVIHIKCDPNRLRGYGAVGVESGPFLLLWPVAYTTACTTVQAVISCRGLFLFLFFIFIFIFIYFFCFFLFPLLLTSVIILIFLSIHLTSFVLYTWNDLSHRRPALMVLTFPAAYHNRNVIFFS